MESSPNIKIEWSKEAVSELIIRWEENECLYNCKSALYHNKHARYEAFDNITTKMANILPGITTQEIKTKLNYLRNQYGKELQKINESGRSGAGTDDLYVPTAYWFNQLSFLKDYLAVRKGKSSITEGLDESLHSDVEESYSTAKRPRKNKDDDDASKIFTTANDLITKIMKSEDSGDNFIEKLISFLKENIKFVTDQNLRDELSEKLISIVFEFKCKQRNLT